MNLIFDPGPLHGGTSLRIMGAGFYPSSKIQVRFTPVRLRLCHVCNAVGKCPSTLQILDIWFVQVDAPSPTAPTYSTAGSPKSHDHHSKNGSRPGTPGDFVRLLFIYSHHDQMPQLAKRGI